MAISSNLHEKSIRIVSLRELPIAAAEIVPLLEQHPVAAFHGPMGAGKTTLISEICRRMGVEDAVASPTFALVNHYVAADGHPIYHFDFYRLDRPEEAFDFGCEEYFDSGAICLIEWPEKIGTLLPDDALRITIEPGMDEVRTICVKTPLK